MADQPTGITAPSNPAEKDLLAAAAEGRVAVFADKPTIRAIFISDLVCVEYDARPVAAPGVRIKGARIQGPLVLAHHTLKRPLSLLDCDIPEGIDLSAARTAMVTLSDSRIGTSQNGKHAILGEFAKIQGSLILDGAVILGGCHLAHVFIEGQFSAKKTKLEYPQKEPAEESQKPAVDLSDSEIGGVVLDGAEVTGAFQLIRSIIKGEFLANYAEFTNPGGDALMAQRIRTRSVFLDGAKLKGNCDFNGATVEGQFAAEGANFESPSGAAITATSARIGVWILRARQVEGASQPTPTSVTGEIRLIRTCILQHLEISGTHVKTSSHTAIWARSLEVHGNCLIGPETILDGCLYLHLADIKGQLDLKGSRIRSSEVARQAGDLKQPEPEPRFMDSSPWRYRAVDLTRRSARIACARAVLRITRGRMPITSSSTASNTSTWTTQKVNRRTLLPAISASGRCASNGCMRSHARTCSSGSGFSRGASSRKRSRLKATARMRASSPSSGASPSGTRRARAALQSS